MHIRAKPEVLRLAVASDGEIWYAVGRGDPLSFGGDHRELLRSEHLVDRPLLIPGDAGHARLLLDLYRSKLRGQIDSVCVCSAAGSNEATPAQKLEALLAYRRRPASLGGPHEIDAVDAATCRLAAEASLGLTTGPRWLGLVRAHPLYGHLAFVDGLDERHAGLLLVEVFDPTARTDPRRPDDPLPLYRYFGLAPGGGPFARQRYVCLETAWSGSPRDRRSPGAFLHRLASGRGSAGRGRAGRRFLDYVAAGWRDLVGRSHRGRLFVPKLFFHRPVEAVAYGPSLRRGRKP